MVKPHLRILYLVLLLVFIANKLYLRPWVLAQDAPPWLDTVVLSLPNFIEAMMGTLLLTAMALIAQQRRLEPACRWPTGRVYWVTTIAAAIYVILQEIKVHNLGGNNTYDPYDVVASVIGLILSYLLMRKYGVLREEEGG